MVITCLKHDFKSLISNFLLFIILLETYNLFILASGFVHTLAYRYKLDILRKSVLTGFKLVIQKINFQLEESSATIGRYKQEKATIQKLFFYDLYLIYDETK